MRGVWVVLVSMLVLVAAGCGSGSDSVGAGESAGAELLKPGALVYWELDSDPDSDQWQQAEELIRRFPDGDKWLAELEKQIASKSELTWEEVRSVLGGDAAIAVYAKSMADVQAVGVLRPDDVDEALELIRRVDEEELEDPLVARRVGDWIAVSDKEASIDAALKTGDGQALSDDESFQDGMAELPEDSLSRVYVDVASAFETFGQGRKPGPADARHAPARLRGRLGQGARRRRRACGRPARRRRRQAARHRRGVQVRAPGSGPGGRARRGDLQGHRDR